MKIDNPENKWNIIPKAASIFPLFAALMLLHGEHFIFKVLSALCFSLAIYTFFFTKYERYLDTDKKCIIKRINWLFIKTENIETVNHFESVVIALGETIGNSNLQGITSTMTFDVVLVRKYAVSKTHSGLGGLENFLLKTLIRDVSEANEFASMVAKALELPVESDKELIKFLRYDPTKTRAF